MQTSHYHLKDLYNNVDSNILLSNKIYKIIGLKCNPSDLPESLYFALNDNIYFRIPYLSNQNIIIENSIQKNIMLIGKILSYFELEEVEQESIVSQNRHLTRFEPFIKNKYQKNYIVRNKRKWFYDLTKQLDSIFKADGSMPRAMGYFAEKITSGDIEKYNEFKRSGNYTDLLNKFIDNKITVGGKSKKNKPEESFPNSLKKLYIDLINSYDNVMNLSEEIVKFSLTEQNISGRMIFTEVLSCLLSFTEAEENEEPGSLSYNIKRYEGSKSFIDEISDMFEPQFKYTEENIEKYNEYAYIFSRSAGKHTNLNTNIDIGYGLFGSTSFSKVFKNEESKELARKMFGTIDVLNIDKYVEEDENAIYYIKELVIKSLYAFGDSCQYLKTCDNIKTLGEGGSRSSVPIFLREPGMSPEVMSIKYKDMINLQWSDELVRTVSFSTRDLEESIRHRYFLTSVTGAPYLDQRNMVVDTMLPQSLFTSHMDLEKTNRLFQSSQNINTKTAYAISPLTAAAYGCKQIPIEHLCRVLGYTKDNIKSMMNIVKNRALNFVFVGAGGTGNNTAIWLSKMLDMANLPFLFQNVYVFEKEAAEIHNLLRFPKDPYSITVDTGVFGGIQHESENAKNKCHIIASELRSLSKATPVCYERYIANNNESSNSYPSNVFSITSETVEVLDENGETVDFETKNVIKPKASTVFYGAPDITTRQNLSNVGSFISATHASNGCNIYINPEQDAMIQVESYGMIQLTPFFMNQLRMAIGLLEILSADNVYELLEMKDHSFLAYEFDGESKLKNDRVYNFKIIPNPEMATENQAVTNAVDF